MTDSPDVRPATDAHAALIPTLFPVAGADAELVSIGERYWALAGFHPELGTAVWCEKTAQIDTSGWGRQIYAVAAAGVRAVVEGVACAKCGGQLSLTSRTAFQQLCDGGQQVCVDCTESLLAAVKVVLNPARKAKREKQKEAEAAQRVIAEARSRWHQQQSNEMVAGYPVEFPSISQELPVAGIREMVGAFALLRYAPASDPFRSVGSWPVPLHPDSEEISKLLGSLVRASLIAIHPSSPASAVVWEPASFEDAVRDAGGDLGAVPQPELTHQFYPTVAHYFAPIGTSMGKAVEGLDGHLAAALAPMDMTAGEQDELLAVAHELLVAEGLRYFEHRLEEVRLPAVPDNHVARLRTALGKVAECRPLGEIYNLVWRVTRGAAEAAQKNPQAPRANLSTHALNQFEGHVQRAVDEPGWEIKPFSEIQGLGLAAMTRTLFYNVLDVHPCETSLAELEVNLPEPRREVSARGVNPPPFDAAADDPLAELIVWLSTADGWNPQDVLEVLDGLKQARDDGDWFEGRVLAKEAAKLLDLYRRLAPAIGVRSAMLSVLAATEMLLHPVSVGETQIASGRWISAKIVAVLVPETAGSDT
ncbi:hypothetical protein [Streptomyces sp. NBC_01244]|uniref:hypothetical protein n=1 Tax=Streptomyces sp. NBC_01244 TaxID=2903797 RepID=UPI002E15681E|nr:hypothetical protein OG247_34025 [Streptomyces sp. NBC_01244]